MHKKLATVLDNDPTIINFSRIEPVVFINIPIQIGIGKVTKAKQKFEPESPDWFKELEQKLFYPEVDRKIWKLHTKTLGEIWEEKSDSVYWSRNLDGDKYTFVTVDEDGEETIEIHNNFVEKSHVHERNNAIAKIRWKCLSDTKRGKHGYEKLGYYTYKSHEAKAQFSEEVEQKGLARKSATKQSTVEITPLEYDSAYMSNRYQEDEL